MIHRAKEEAEPGVEISQVEDGKEKIVVAKVRSFFYYTPTAELHDSGGEHSVLPEDLHERTRVLSAVRKLTRYATIPMSEQCSQS